MLGPKNIYSEGDAITKENVVTKRFKNKVAIVGTSPSSRHLAPYEDPEFEIWSLTCNYLNLPRWDRWFEIHKLYAFEGKSPVVPGLLEWLAQQNNPTQPVYIQESWPSVPNGVIFPREEVQKAFPFATQNKFYTSTIAWMQALAIYMGYTTIGIWGVDMAAEGEYGEQKEGCAFWGGVAIGRGIELIIPKESDLMKSRLFYAYDNTSPMDSKLLARQEELDHRMHTAQNQMKAAEIEYHYLRGARDDIAYTRANWSNGQ